jgi:hypothetical protein
MVVDEGLLQELEPLGRVDVEATSEETADCCIMYGFGHVTEVQQSAGYDMRGGKGNGWARWYEAFNDVVEKFCWKASHVTCPILLLKSPQSCLRSLMINVFHLSVKLMARVPGFPRIEVVPTRLGQDLRFYFRCECRSPWPSFFHNPDNVRKASF